MKPITFMHLQRGLTLVELMVAAVISLIVVLAATAALLISRQGFSQVDTASQLRDNSRYAEEMVQRLAVQAGYRDLIYAATNRPPSTEGLTEEWPEVFGFNNRSRTKSHKSYEADSAERTSDSLGYGSDILVLRYQSSASEIPGTTTDEAIIDCAGIPLREKMVDRHERYSSVLHVGTSNDGEPALMCTRWTQAQDFGNVFTQPLISGVENFQVLYGVDKKTVNASGHSVDGADSVAEQYLRADQLTDASDPAQTLANWKSVRSLRIGMVLRGAPGSAVAATNQTLYPFGSGQAINMFASTDDPGTIFTPPNDGRLRQVVTFTVHLRNPQGDEL